MKNIPNNSPVIFFLSRHYTLKYLPIIVVKTEIYFVFEWDCYNWVYFLKKNVVLGKKKMKVHCYFLCLTQSLKKDNEQGNMIMDN